MAYFNGVQNILSFALSEQRLSDLNAGLLVNSMAAANQEISPELQALAMKDARFKKGQTRSKGGGAMPGGGKRRVRIFASAHLNLCRNCLSLTLCNHLLDSAIV